jgi:iron complex transport system ATP-binding protein
VTLLEINELDYSYQSQKLDNFHLSISNWQIDQGEFVSLLGPNGCGKSTTLKIIARLLKIQKGRIKFSGLDIHEIPFREFAKLVAFVPQNTISIFPFSVYEIVMMGRTPYLGLLGFEAEPDKKVVDDVLDLMEISHLKSKGINEISGGEAQRVFIARALAQNPKLILLDEPNAHLDIEHQISIFELIQQFTKEKNISAIIISHDLNLVGIYSDKIALMDGGKIIMNGEKSEVLNESNIKSIFKVDSTINFSKDRSKANILIHPVI